MARNAASSYGVRLLLAISVLGVTPYLYRRLGPAGFGTWSVMFTFTTVFLLITYGFSAAVTKFVAEQRARGEREEVEQTVGASVTLLAALGVGAMVLSVAVGVLFNGLAADAEADAFRTGMILVGLSALVQFPGMAYGAALAGYQRYDRFSLGEAVIVVVFAAGAIVAVETGGGVLGVAIAQAAAFVAGGLTHFTLMRLTDRELSLRPRLAAREVRRRVGGFGSLALLADSSVFLGERMDTVIIAAIRNAAATAPFAAAVKLQSALQALVLPFLNVMMPVVSELWAVGRRVEVVSGLEVATRVALQLTLPAAIWLALFSSDIVDAWLGSDAQDAATIIVLLASGQVVGLTAFASERTLVGIGRVRWVAALAAVQGAINFGLTLVLVSAQGAKGAALATLIAIVLTGPMKLPLACRATGSTTSSLIRHGVSPALAGALPGVAAMVAVWLIMPSGVPRLAVGFVLGLGLAVAIAIAQVGPGRLRGLIGQITRRAESPEALQAVETQPVEI